MNGMGSQQTSDAARHSAAVTSEPDRSRPKGDIRPTVSVLRCGLSDQPFAADTKSNRPRTGNVRDQIVAREACARFRIVPSNPYQVPILLFRAFAADAD